MNASTIHPDEAFGTPPTDAELVRSWWRVALDHPASAALERVYARASDAIAARAPACWASGRCCNFARTQHRLYVTGLEAAYCLRRLDADNPATDRRALHADLRLALDHAIAQGDCPLLTGPARSLCSAHTIKPLGCRLYFCDRSAEDWQHELSEQLLGEVRALHDAFDVPYRYAEWRATLGLLLEHAPV